MSFPSDIDFSEVENGRQGALIYNRVSTDDQVKYGTSLEEQKESLKKEAEVHGLNVAKIITDGGESGTDFNRDGIKKARRYAAHPDIDYILVDNIDRIGRHTIKTLYFLYKLEEDCDVTIITNEIGNIDVSKHGDMSYAMFRAMSSQYTNETSARRSEASRARQFKNKSWSTAFNTVPLGYSLTDDDWLEVNQQDADIYRNLVMNFLRAPTRRAYQKAKEWTRGITTDRPQQKIKKELQRPLYVGRPRTRYDDGTQNNDETSYTTVTDDSLRIIPEETRERVLDKIEEIAQAYGGGGDDTDDIESLVGEFGPTQIVEVGEIIQARCPECDGQMNENGRREIMARTVHMYTCKSESCGISRKFPYKTELEELESSDD